MFFLLKWIRAAWRCRWGGLRLAIAAFALWVLVADTSARLARMQLAALPDFDFAAEVRTLREAGRYGEAIDIAEAGLVREGLSQSARESIQRERTLTADEQVSWLRRGTDALKGVALGADADSSLERLVGAVGADFFIIGDLRDLAIQGWTFATAGEADGVIAALSAIGLVTTLAPEIDWAPSILKAARRTGAMSQRLGGFIVRAVKGREIRTIEAIVTDTASIARRTSPATASRLLRLADEPAQVARVARFVEAEGRAGAFVLRTTGREGRAVLRSADELRAAGRVEDAVRTERVLFAAAGKGEAGTAWLKRGLWRPLTRPHPLVGIAKAAWSGHAAGLIERAIQRLDPSAWWAIPALIGWMLLEVGLIGSRMRASLKRAPTSRNQGQGSRSVPVTQKAAA